MAAGARVWYWVRPDPEERSTDDKWQLTGGEPGEFIRLVVVVSKQCGDKTVMAVRTVTLKKQRKTSGAVDDTSTSAHEYTEDTNETPSETEATTDNNGASPVLPPRAPELSDINADPQPHPHLLCPLKF